MTGSVDGHFVSFSADYSLLNAGTKRAESVVDRGSRRMASSFDQLSTLGARFAAGFAGFFVVDKFIDVGRAAVEAASDVEEMESKFNVVFGQLNSEADQFARSQSDAVGRAVSEYKGYLASLQDTFVPMGFARDQAFELSKGLSALGVDLASFNNTTDSEAINSLTSALVGNHEAVRRYGIQITEASLKQALLDQGFQGNTQSATEQQKVLARMSIILSSTSDAQGDAARTADSYANASKRLDASLLGLQEDIGAEVLPALARLKTAMAEGIESFRLWRQNIDLSVFKTLPGPIGDVARGVSGINEALTRNQAAAEATKALRGAIMENGQAVKDGNSAVSESDAVYARLNEQLKNMFSTLEAGPEKIKKVTDPLTNPDNWRVGTSIEIDPAYQQDLQIAQQEFGLLQQAGNAISSRLSSGFQAFASGSKVAFGDLAKSLLADLSTILFKAIAVKAVLSALGLPGAGASFAPTAGGSSTGIGQAIFGGVQSLTGGSSVASVQSAVATASGATGGTSVPSTGTTIIYQIDATGADVGAKERVEAALVAAQNQPSAVEQVGAQSERFPTESF